MQWRTLIVIAVVLVAFLVWRRSGKAKGEEARRLVAAGARLIDVRTPAEFSGGHLDGATNVPVDELEARLASLGSKEQRLVVYCRSGVRSARAARVLERAGFRSVFDLGGKGNW